MTSPDRDMPSRVVLLATGGTIAGTADSAADTLGYRPAQIGVERLVSTVPALANLALEPEQVAQIDSKDADFEFWHLLARCVDHHLRRDDVVGIVITHGTDTLEETAYLLQRVLAPRKPVVITGAMHPATALQTDGPQNLVDAVALVQAADAPAGVSVVFAGRVLAAMEVRKRHTRRLDAFGCGDAGDLGSIDAGKWRRFREAPAGAALGLSVLERAVPRVEIVTSHAGADGAMVDALVSDGVAGIVVAGTGNGTVHRRLEAALLRAQSAGVAVLRSTRVAVGGVVDVTGSLLPASDAATAAQARIELMLELMATSRGAVTDLRASG